jgi:hypothetical protein
MSASMQVGSTGAFCCERRRQPTAKLRGLPLGLCQRAGDEIPEGLLGLLPVVLVHVHHQRRDAAMPTERANLVQAEPGALPELRGLGNARVPVISETE